ncbi:hypothetical protein FQA39_LY11673 [Lamprigera yunnana]|nr:hypothetical protein FQA39_LY11673 [Lamprigera yunnana]
MKAYIFVLIAISLQCICASYIDVIVQEGDYEKYVEKICIGLSKVSPQLVENLKSKGIFVDNKELKEFMSCYNSMSNPAGKKDIGNGIMMKKKRWYL